MAIIKKTKVTNAGEDMEKRECCTATIEEYGGSPKIKMEQPYDLATPLVGVYPKKTKSLI